MNAFCTIITADYIHYSLALRKSLLSYGDQFKFYVLVSNPKEGLKQQIETTYPGTFIVDVGEVCKDGIGKSIYDKYYSSDVSAFRWSMKPVLIKYLLTVKGHDKVIYADSDIYFFNDYNFLFEELNQCNAILTPHWRASDPHIDLPNFEILYTKGIYNGGFFGATKYAIGALEWWAMACEFICIIDASKGMYGDQVHLNLLPVYFDKICIVKHRGCNVANWNMVECKRTMAPDGESVVIAGEYPIVFIHFTKSMIDGIASGVDRLLLPYLEKYYAAINAFAGEVAMRQLVLPPMVAIPTPAQKATPLRRIKTIVRKIIG